MLDGLQIFATLAYYLFVEIYPMAFREMVGWLT